MKKENLLTILIIIFWMIGKFSLHILAQDFNISRLITSIISSVWLAICLCILSIYFKHTHKG